MPTTISDHVKRIRDALTIVLPELDTSVGTIPRKMIDVFAESLAEVSIDQYINDYQYDIDAVSGSALDDLVRLFGFSRLPARRATGEITIERAAGSTRNLVISVNTQFATDDIPPVLIGTIVPAIMITGDTSITIPAQALVPGSNGNIVANAIKRAGSPITGVSGYTNLVAFTGGSDAESDDALRSRFKRTVFRNLAGTSDQAAGVALENVNAVAANVIGPVKRHREQIELVSGTGDSTIPNAKYIFDPAVYAGTAFFGVDVDGDDTLQFGVIWDMTIVDNMDGTFTPRITSLAADVCPDGIYELDFAYLPRASRNDPDAGVMNRVDVWVDGTDVVEATETAKYDTASVFTNVDTDALYRGNFQRVSTEETPLTDNIFIPLHFTPLTDASVNDSIVIGGETYYEGSDYHAVNDITAFGMSPQSACGLEWLVAANGGNATQPADETLFPLTYLYNAVPIQVQKALQNWRLLTQDYWVHASLPIRLNFHFVAVLKEGYSASQVRSDMIPIVREVLAGIGFANILQASDVLNAAYSTPGVDALRYKRDDEGAAYGIARVNALGTVISASEFWDATHDRVEDVFVDDDSTPHLNDIFITVKAPNTWQGA